MSTSKLSLLFLLKFPSLLASSPDLSMVEYVFSSATFLPLSATFLPLFHQCRVPVSKSTLRASAVRLQCAECVHGRFRYVSCHALSTRHVFTRFTRVPATLTCAPISSCAYSVLVFFTALFRCASTCQHDALRVALLRFPSILALRLPCLLNRVYSLPFPLLALLLCSLYASVASRHRCFTLTNASY